MKTYLYWPATTTALLLQLSAAASQDIRLATEGAFPPFNFLDDAGELTGFERELGDALCERANLSCTWSLNDWESMLPNLIAGNFDAILAGMGITEERDKVIDFTDAYVDPIPSSYVVLENAGNTCPDGPVAAQTGSIQASYLVENGIELAEFPTLEEALAQQRSGEIARVFAGKPALEPFVAAEDSELTFACDDVILGDGIGIGLRESDPDLKTKFNLAIASLREDGTLAEITERWLE